MVWDYIVDAFESIIDFVSGMFEDLGDFSAGGLVFGMANLIFVFLLRKQMLYPFLQKMGLAEYYFWMIVTYAGCFLGGYLIGKRLFDD